MGGLSSDSVRQARHHIRGTGEGKSMCAGYRVGGVRFERGAETKLERATTVEVQTGSTVERFPVCRTLRPEPATR